MQRDPWGYVDGMGLYEYVKSKPSFYVDPTGTSSAHHPATVSQLIASGATVADLQAILGISAGAAAALIANHALDRIEELNRTKGPDCRRSVLNNLNEFVNRLKGQVRGCNRSMCCDELRRMARLWSTLRSIRTARDNKCWRGGDRGHRVQRRDAGTNAGKCWRYYYEKGC